MARLDEILAALACAPALPGARCRGRPHLFDGADRGEPADVVTQRHALAVELCAGCPSLDPCSAWIDSLPARDRPAGITAGQLHPRGPGRPRKDNPNR